MMFMANISFLMTQEIPSLVPSLPTSPQAETFKRYGTFSINYSTGVPDISIPLFEINHHGYSLPLELKYYPQPLKQGYNYDVVGHGWNLSINSCISRSIEHCADEEKNFIVEEPTGYYKDCGDCFKEFNYAHDLFNAILPDGSSFDFVIDNINGSLKFTTSNGRSVKMSCNYTPTNISSFVITDENGVKYTFSEGDIYGPAELYYNNFVSWTLSRIDLPFSNEPILFYYNKLIDNKYGNVENNIHLWDSYFPDSSDYIAPSPVFTPFLSYRMKLLTSVTYNGTTINFNYANETSPSAKNYISNIQVIDSSLIKNIDLFIYTQNVTSSGGTVPVALLGSLQVKGSEPNDTPLIHTLQYTSIANTFSGTDYWGYLNNDRYSDGVGNFNLYSSWIDSRANSYDVMGISEATRLPGDQCPLAKIKLAKYNGFNRTPGSTVGHGILTKIIYPYGGYTEFEFDNHEFLTSTDGNGDYILNPVDRIPAIAGGFRIEKISSFREDGALADVKTFRYGLTYAEAYAQGGGDNYNAENYPNMHTGLGEATVDPNIFTFMNFTTYQLAFPFQNLIIGRDEERNSLLVNPCVVASYPMHQTGYVWRADFNAGNFRKLLNGRPPVLYSNVTVYDGIVDEYSNSYPNGKTVYKYNILDSGYDMFNVFHDQIFFEEMHYLGNVLVNKSKQFLYDKISERRDYKFNGQDFIMVRKQNNSWLSSLKPFNDWHFLNLYPDPYIPNIYTYTVDLFSTGSSYFGTARLDYKTEIQYHAPGDSILVRESYGYNSRDQITSQITKNSNNKYLKRIWEYPEIKTGYTTPVTIQKLVERNMISPILKDSVCVADSYEGLSNGMAVSGRKVDYNEYAIGGISYILPQKSYRLEISGSSNKYNPEYEISSYSFNGNPTEIISKDGLHTSYLWGYRNRYMIAQIENATYDQVKQTLGVDSETLSSSTVPDMSKVEAIRTYLPNAHIITYTYKPLVGITSSTSPDGITSNFIYDPFGRLQFVKDAGNDVINQYYYHHKH